VLSGRGLRDGPISRPEGMSECGQVKNKKTSTPAVSRQKR
jgi:hypothetical protein